ncbi:amidohydrolase family protein [Frankia sp. ACN1ag]|uniref:amidohydrolase family protein n=1 Tax=Frankia sp. ACN1ag TaxID=102891 RepID=UPI0006DC369C|nr:amidohydrolase family protein [Frankia sp. ACN1ag]KQC37720.1 amidohydrolase [Frankia sp. ACN1ag]
MGRAAQEPERRALLVRRAELTGSTELTGSAGGGAAGPGRRVLAGALPPTWVADVRILGGRIVEVSAEPLRPRAGEDILDADGGALLPGLHDHHVHLLSLAASASSVRVGPPEVVDAAGLRAALRAAPGTGPARWVRAVGYHPSVAGDLDRRTLDALLPDRPVRVQHRGGALWVFNSPALRLAGIDGCDLPGVERDPTGAPTGRLWRMDGWLRRHAALPPVAVDLAAVGRAAAAAGITGFTDATPGRTAEHRRTLAAAAATGELPQRLTLMRPEPQPTADADAPAGRRAGEGTVGVAGVAGGVGGGGGVRVVGGPVKVILDDDTLPDLDTLAARFAAAHRAGHPVAVHCVTRVQTVLTLAALDLAGPRRGDRLEHGAVIPGELYGQVRRAGLVVVTQPNFVAERGDRYLVDVTDEDPAALYPAASLVRAGIGLAAGTDAPFGHPDPWRAVAAAVTRRTAAGIVLGADERLDAPAALALFLGDPADPARPRRVRPGARADLCLLHRPLRAALRAALRDPSAAQVRQTIVDGVPVYG